jgi:hypothetical protein
MHFSLQAVDIAGDERASFGNAARGKKADAEQTRSRSVVALEKKVAQSPLA